MDMVEKLHKQGVQFKSLTDAIDTNTASGRFFFHVMASLAEMERELTPSSEPAQALKSPVSSAAKAVAKGR